MFFKEPEEEFAVKAPISGGMAAGARGGGHRHPGHRHRALVAVGRRRRAPSPPCSVVSRRRRVHGGSVLQSGGDASRGRLGAPDQQSALREARCWSRTGGSRRWGPPRSCGPGSGGGAVQDLPGLRASARPRQRPHPPGLLGLSGLRSRRAASASGCCACSGPGGSSTPRTTRLRRSGAPTSAPGAGSPASPTLRTKAGPWRAPPRAAGLRARVYLEVFGLDEAELPAAMERLEERLDRLREECGQPAPPTAVGPSRAPGRGRHLPSRSLHGVGPALPGGGPLRAPRRGCVWPLTWPSRRPKWSLLAGRRAPIIALAYKAAHLWNGQRWRRPGCGRCSTWPAPGPWARQTLAVHACRLDDADIATSGRRRGGVAHCPRSNLRLRCGSRAGGRAAGPPASRWAGHRQPGLQRRPGHVRGDAGGRCRG